MSSDTSNQTMLLPSLSSEAEGTSDLTLEKSQALSDPNRTTDLTLANLKESFSKENDWEIPFLEYESENSRETFLLNKPSITIGRDKGNSLCLDIANLSRVHCKITRQGGFWILEDCESINGTFLNHRKLLPGQKLKLFPHAKIRLGLTSFEFRYRLQKLERKNEGTWLFHTVAYFFLSSLWHSILLFTCLFLLWKSPVSLPGSDALRVQLLEPEEIKIPLKKTEETLPSVSKEIEEEPTVAEPVTVPEEVPVTEETDTVSSPQLDYTSKSVRSSEPDLSNTSLSKRLFSAPVRQKKKDSGEKRDGNDSKESVTEVTLDPVETGDPLLSKVRQLKESILVLNVNGSYDQSGFVLERLKIKSKTVPTEVLMNLLQATPQKSMASSKKLDLPPYLDPEKHVLVLNCGCLALGSPKIFAEKLIDFIGRGGYVITTDWSLDIWEVAFPKWIQSGPKSLPQGDYAVYLPQEAKNHPLLHGAPAEKKQFKWHVDVSSSYPMIQSSRVCPLVMSKRGVPVAVTFSYQKTITSETAATSYPGRVLHYVSHLNQQENPQTGEYNLQLILVNFLLLKQKEFESIQQAISKK